MSGWISAHLFYHADPFPLLSECVSPLVEDLRRQGVISRYFFIRYYENGPHIRLRLQPADPGAEDEIRKLVECRTREFFTRRPALYPLDMTPLVAFSKAMFMAEYGETAYREKYGDGPIPMYDNNSMRFIDYAPEYKRYGGVRGVDLAEWHFEASSDTVLSMFADPNMKVQRIKLGLALQMLVLQAYAMWKTDETVYAFISVYLNHWKRIAKGATTDEKTAKRFERRWTHMAPRVIDRLGHVRSLMRGEREPVDYERRWMAHCEQLAASVRRLVDEAAFELPEGVTGFDQTMEHLFPTYFHMTANRLGVSIEDEIYLAYLASRGLEAVMDVGSVASR